MLVTVLERFRNTNEMEIANRMIHVCCIGRNGCCHIPVYTTTCSIQLGTITIGHVFVTNHVSLVEVHPNSITRIWRFGLSDVTLGHLSISLRHLVKWFGLTRPKAEAAFRPL